MEDFSKYPKIYAYGHDENKDLLKNPDHTIIIEEKIDGGNMRFMFCNGIVIFGTRRTQMTSDEGEETYINKNFRRCIDFIKSKLTQELINKYDRHIFFGENCIKHSMEYDWDKIPPYLGFDIYSIELNRMLNYKEKKAVFVEQMGFELVPNIKTVKASEITKVDEDMIPVSVYAPRGKPDNKAEGIVMKNYEAGVFAKLVTAHFKEVNAEVFGGTPKFQEDDTGKIIARYCVNARIEKCIFKLVDEGNKLDMSLMGSLPHFVAEDIWSENWREIIKKYQEIKPREIKKLIAKRCQVVLNQIIINNSLNSEEQ